MTLPLADWLALREPADTAARSATLTRVIADVVAPHAPVRILDLATGTGANLRYLAERLPPHQAWLLADVDPNVLARVHEQTASWAAERGYTIEKHANGFALRGATLDCSVAVREANLSALPPELFAGRHLVTASALLDLVSEAWLELLAQRCRVERAAALFALNYDGRSSCEPAEPEDDLLRDGLNRHQLNDKGLGGPAAGPDADWIALRVFEEAGFVARREPADWRLGPRHAELQRELMEGWAEATVELEPALAAKVASWRERRLAHLASGRSSVRVGHHDVAAWLAE